MYLPSLAITRGLLRRSTVIAVAPLGTFCLAGAALLASRVATSYRESARGTSVPSTPPPLPFGTPPHLLCRLHSPFVTNPDLLQAHAHFETGTTVSRWVI